MLPIVIILQQNLDYPKAGLSETKAQKYIFLFCGSFKDFLAIGCAILFGNIT